MVEEIDIEWIPEDTGAPYEVDMNQVLMDTPAHIVDKWCKEKFGHTNWARMGMVTPEELVTNPYEMDMEEGIIYFKNSRNV